MLCTTGTLLSDVSEEVLERQSYMCFRRALIGVRESLQLD
jgi:hypothetical protein